MTAFGQAGPGAGGCYRLVRSRFVPQSRDHDARQFLRRKGAVFKGFGYVSAGPGVVAVQFRICPERRGYGLSLLMTAVAQAHPPRGDGAEVISPDVFGLAPVMAKGLRVLHVLFLNGERLIAEGIGGVKGHARFLTGRFPDHLPVSGDGLLLFVCAVP